MTTLFIIIFVVLIATLVAVVALRPAPRVRQEPLGNPHPTLNEPVVRTESRHHDTPAGADLDRHSGRHDD